MNLRPIHLFSLSICACLSLQAQTLEPPQNKPPGPSEEVRKAIEEFNRAKSEKRQKANEVTVVLEPPAPPKAVPVEDPHLEEKKALLVRGKVPEKAELARQDQPQEEIVRPDSSSQKPEELGLEVRVESIRKGSGLIDPKTVTLKSRFPAKPLSSASEGWIMKKLEGVPAVNREIELQPGTMVSLEISPHVLIPEIDSNSVFSVNEPGFDAIDGYQQKQTVSAILATSVVQLDEDAKQLGSAISELTQILSSLPRPSASDETPNPSDNTKP